jgi:SAM-dependent methyltransferase/uncharacterized protein YbaR (Trm112 family)
MRERLLTMLRCKHCGGRINTARIISTHHEHIEYGLLKCVQCQFNYPVVEGIPIIGSPQDRLNSWAETTDSTIIAGARIKDITTALQKKTPVHTFSLLLNSARRKTLLELVRTAYSEPAITSLKEYLPPARRLEMQKLSHLNIAPGRLQRLLENRLLSHVRLRLARFLSEYRNALSAYSALDIYYSQYSGSEMFNYFFYRFGQPRYLAALCLATVLSKVSGAVLDLACGAGHLTHYLSRARPSFVIVGMDRDFFRLFVASKYIAPAADFVCSPASNTLSFANSCFDAILCSDAFHYFPEKWGVVNEMRRIIVPHGLILLTRVGNAALEPRMGYELIVDGYRNLFSWTSHAMIDEDRLINSYLEKKGPNLGQTEDVREYKWLSIVATDRKDLYADYDRLDDWPHAVGRLVINPIYVPDESSSPEGRKFKFRFPSEHYAYEDHRYSEYTPSEWFIPQDVLAAIRNKKRIPSMEEHIRKFVVIGVPEKYF